MASRPDSRFTIANLMVLIASTALALAMITIPGFGSVLIAYVILAFLLVVSIFLTVRRVMELVYGLDCPACGQRGLERRSILSFGERFFSCPACGIRCRRGLYSAFGFFLWKDASSPQYDTHYQRPVEEDPWNAPPGLEDEEESVTSKTHANLVRNKRLRTPENPNGPGLE
jgi:hypothetical protein